MSDLIVIGGGPAGITAALEAAGAGAAVSLVSGEPVGGRANWHSLLPSKVFLTAADRLGEAEHHPQLGLSGGRPRAELPALRERIVALAKERSLAYRDELEARGVRILSGKARFTDAHRIEVVGEDGSSTSLAFADAIIATGSGPRFPEGVRPDGKRILAPRLAAALAEWPAHIVVVGGGVTGAEFAYLFAGVGAQVSWVTDLSRILPRSDADLADALEGSLAARGVTVIKNAPVTSARAEETAVSITLEDGRKLRGSHAFLALGRGPDVAELNLPAAGVAFAADGIRIDGYCRTSQPHIYAAGDVVGAPFVVNRAQAQARVAALHAAGRNPQPFRAETVVEAVYTHPQLAQVGLTEQQAEAVGRAVKVTRAGYDQALKAHLADQPHGLVKIIADAGDGRIVGGGAVGDHAADILAPLAVAIAAGMTGKDLAAHFFAHPSLSELVGIAARAG